MNTEWQKLLSLTALATVFLLISQIHSKPMQTTTSTTLFQMPQFPALNYFLNRNNSPQPKSPVSVPMKKYSGKRMTLDSLLMIYYHDQTIAIVELGPEKILYGCELIEINDDKEGLKFLKKLSSINRPYAITFQQMIKLMGQCDIVEAKKELARETDNLTLYNDKPVQLPLTSNNDTKPAGILSTFFSQGSRWFNVIVPGTKWCGAGDVADAYQDLGTDYQMDMCCRTHDICPVKVRAYGTRYNVTNNSLYSKSHCACDDMLFNCLKSVNTTSSQTIGNIYFNLVQVQCIQENVDGSYTFRPPREF